MNYEDFDGDYAELYVNFLFSYELFLEELGEEGIRELRELLKEPDSKLITFCSKLVEKIVNEKALDTGFVVARMITFLPLLIAKIN